MTARKPLESMDAPSDESLEITSSRQESPKKEGASGDDRASIHADLERGEASISRTLEAILSKTDDDEVPLIGTTGTTGETSGGTGKGLGSHTLLGLGGYGTVKLPGVTPVEDDAAGPSISVDTMFDDPEDVLRGKAMAPPVGPAGLEGGVEIEREEAAGEKVGDLLDEVAQALNVQAAETRDRAIGRIPSPGANAPGSRSSMKTPLVRTAEEFEFEDPDDGPTTLNAGDGKLEAAAGQRGPERHDEENEEDDEESVVLGPGARSEGKREARLSGSHPGANLGGTGGRTTLPIPAVPMPGSAAAASSRPTRATPFAGLPAATLPTFPAPGSGRTRLPTPAPGTALGGAGPTGAARTAPPPGAPQGATSGARDESPGAMLVDVPAGRRSSGRTSAPSATLAAGDIAGRNGAVEEPHPSALSSARVILEQTLLKKDLKFRPISIGGIVLGAFVGGLFIGHAVLRGSSEATPAAASTAAPASGSAPAVAASRPADPAVVAPVAPAAPANPATRPATTAVVTEVPKNTVAAPAANPNGAVIESPPVGTAQMQFDEPPTRKRRPHRAVTVSTEDLDIPSTPKRVASVAPPPVSKTPTAGKSGPKKKSTWHDPFAD